MPPMPQPETVTVTAEWLMPDGSIVKVSEVIPAVWIDDAYTAVDHAESLTVDGAVELNTAYLEDDR